VETHLFLDGNRRRLIVWHGCGGSGEEWVAEGFTVNERGEQRVLLVAEVEEFMR
jgi:hypothetical protein